MESRLAACNFWLQFTSDQFEKILFPDEKWFILKQAPNRKKTTPTGVQKTQTTWFTASRPTEPRLWPGLRSWMAKGCLSTGSVDAAAYMEMLKTVVWSAVRGSVSSIGSIKTGQACTLRPRRWTSSSRSSGNRIISRKFEHNWPPTRQTSVPWISVSGPRPRPTCPDASPPLQELKTVVEDFAGNFDPAKTRSMASYARYRAELCVSLAGEHIESLVKKSRSRDD